MLRLLRNATAGRGLLNYIHVNGVDFLIAAASTHFSENAAWLETVCPPRVPKRAVRAVRVVHVNGLRARCAWASRVRRVTAAREV